MKKIFKLIGSFFGAIYKVFDKILITPISRLIYLIHKKANFKSNTLEKILNRKQSLIIFSLLISIGIFLLVNSRAVSLVEKESEILSNQPVNVIYNKEKYVVEGVPNAVDVILIGRKSDLYLAKQLDDHEIVLDLSDYKTGEYNVKLKYNHSVESVTYKIDPSSVKVTISEKVSSVKTLTYDLLNQDSLDSKLNVSEVELENSEVYVKGAKTTLDKIATVKALIDVSKLKIDSSGTYKIDDSNVEDSKKSITLVAYDNDGNAINNVEIVPNTVVATIKVDSYYVDLPIKVVPKKGTEMATGFAIESATTSASTIRVYGDQDVIKGLTYIEAPIDVQGLNKDKSFSVNLTKPTGVRYMSETNVSVDVKVAEEATKELAGISMQYKNLGSDYVANTLNIDDTTTTVILKGASTLIDAIKPEDVTAYVDLSGLGAGTHEVEVEISGDQTLVTYSPKVKTIQIKIANKG